MDAKRPTPQQARPAGLRRNDPCWCGSGRKYKKCHLRADEESEEQARRPAPPHSRDWWEY